MRANNYDWFNGDRAAELRNVAERERAAINQWVKDIKAADTVCHGTHHDLGIRRRCIRKAGHRDWCIDRKGNTW